MKIGILGISGRVATRIMREALNRGHEVVGIDPVKGPNVDDAVDFHQLDMEDVEGIAQAIRGCDAYIFTVIPVLKNHPRSAVRDRRLQKGRGAADDLCLRWRLQLDQAGGVSAGRPEGAGTPADPQGQ